MGAVAFNGGLLLAVLYIPASLVYAGMGLPHGGIVAAVSAVPLLLLIKRFYRAGKFIDGKLANALEDFDEFRVCSKGFPGYRFVDLFNALEAFAKDDAKATRIESQHSEGLQAIVAREFASDETRTIMTPSRFSRPVDHDQERFFAADTFYIFRELPCGEVGKGVVLRLRRPEYSAEVYLEVGARLASRAETIIEFIVKYAGRNSIYRNRTIEVAFEAELRQLPWGEVEQGTEIDVLIKPPSDVTRDNIVLDETVSAVLERNIIDVHRRREALLALGVPSTRGVLFYGPPGTGKTYTCKYIAHRLEDATVVVASGHALHRIKSVFNVARMLQPSVVVLEDVDLVFASRDQNMHGSSVGELLDELDGFAKDAAVIFILTTNAIERVEAAIKDRPGRISQCILFDLPSATLRDQYLRKFLAPYDSGELDVERLVKATDRSSQAFLKEFVFRGVQIASENYSGEKAGLKLENTHFDEALDEMKQSAGRQGAAIVGFHGGEV